MIGRILRKALTIVSTGILQWVNVLSTINVVFVENRMVVFEFILLFLKWYFLDVEVDD